MDIENLPPKIQFVFIAMMQSAIELKEMDKDKEFYLDFAKEIWESMELSDFDYLKEVIMGKMRKDIESHVKSYMKTL
jgi:hypothetical protein